MSGHQLRLYNSLGRRIDDFVPASNPAGMYSCGPTVYAFPHLGNMRAYVFADTVRRALRWKGIKVRHVVNITDVGHAVADTDTGEDKVEAAAAKEQRSVRDIAEFYTDAFFDDIRALNILPADPAITPEGQRAVVAAADALLGLSLATLDSADLDKGRAKEDLTPTERHAIEQLVADRTQARKEHDWPRADQIRAELDARGVQVADTPEGPLWHLR